MNKLSSSIIDYIKRSDIVLWLLTLAAIIYSLLLIWSMQRAGNYNYLKMQLLAVAIGLTVAFVISVADYRYFVRKWYFAAAIAIFLAILVFIFGIQVVGTDDTAWIELPGGISFQPSEFIKICFIITFSKHLTYLEEKNMIKTFFGVITLALHAIFPMAVIHIRGDDGTVLIFIFIFITMSFLAGVQLRYFAIMGAGLIIGIPLVWNFYLNNEHRNRILALFDLDGNAMSNYGWQQYQGKISIASGQLTGEGLFNGDRVEYGIVPEQANDFIFTVAGEELGFAGCIILLGLLLLIAVKIIINMNICNDIQGKFVCSGVFALISSQTIVNIGMVLGFIPVIGITLPLFSAGGTSALSTLICLGLVQSVRQHNIDDINTAKIRRGSESRIRL